MYHCEISPNSLIQPLVSVHMEFKDPSFHPYFGVLIFLMASAIPAFSLCFIHGIIYPLQKGIFRIAIKSLYHT